MSRLPNSSLIIQPKENRISELYVIWQHLIHYHIQVSGLIARCENAGTYLIGRRREYKPIIRCCQCSWPRALFQEILALPIECHGAAFQTHAFVRVDYAGPIVVWEDKKSKEIRYNCQLYGQQTYACRGCPPLNNLCFLECLPGLCRHLWNPASCFLRQHACIYFRC